MVEVIDGLEGDADVSVEDGHVGGREPVGVRDGGDPEVTHGGRARAEQRGCDIRHHAVDHTGAQPGRRRGGSALEPHVTHVELVQGREDQVRVALADEQARGAVVEHAGGGRYVAPAHHHAQGLTLVVGPVGVAHRQARVVGEDGAGADHDRPGGGAQPVHVGAGRGAGDPLAAAVARRRTAVDGGGELPGHEGPPVGHRVRERLDQRVRPLDRHQVAPDAGRPQRLRAPDGHGVGVRQGVGDAPDPRPDQGLGARTGPAGVVARLQRHVGRAPARVVPRRTRLGESDELGVRGAGAAVPALADHLAVTAQQDAAHPRVGVGCGAVGGQRHGSAHQHEVPLGVVVVTPMRIAPVVGGGLAAHLVPLARCWCARSGG